MFFSLWVEHLIHAVTTNGRSDGKLCRSFTYMTDSHAFEHDKNG